MYKELKKALKNVPDTYDDFVAGMCCTLKNDDENIQKVIAYIKDNPDSKSDDIIEYLDELGV